MLVSSALVVHGSRFMWCARALVVFEIMLGVLVFRGHRRHEFPFPSLSIVIKPCFIKGFHFEMVTILLFWVDH